MQDGSPFILKRRLLPKPTAVFESYWRFASRRQNIFERRVRGDSPPWTTDPILARYKFTNAFRASDRTSQFLIRQVIYDRNRPARDTFFRILLFKLFNRIDTWQHLERCLGDINLRRFSWDHCDNLLTEALGRGNRIYSGAYIMPSGRTGEKKHRFHLGLLRQVLRERLPERLLECRNMQETYAALLAYRSIGPFLAYQLATDLNYSPHLNFSEMEFVAAGPGARDGIKKCFASLGEFSETQIIHWMADNQDHWFERYDLAPCRLWGRPLQLIDCQNLFCETDKYARVAHPEVKGLSGRKRIKQAFRPRTEPLSVWYPPKWQLNDRILCATAVSRSA